MSDNKNGAGLYVNELIHGGVITTPEVAREFAALVLGSLYGDEELAKQQPLRVVDQGRTWLVEGSHQWPDGAAGSGSWFMTMQKRDAKVLKLGFRLPMDIPDEVKVIISKAPRD
jgi:hypothetical protein